jgi:hypothetical protein
MIIFMTHFFAMLVIAFLIVLTVACTAAHYKGKALRERRLRDAQDQAIYLTK